VDYAHNAASCQALLETARALGRARLVLAASAPGDRRDTDLDEIGRLCAQGADAVVFYEMTDRRGRAPGEVAGRMAAAAAAAGRNAETRLDAAAALLRAAELCNPADLLVLACASGAEDLASLAPQLQPMRPEEIAPVPLPVRRRVLVVDDNQDAADALAASLRSEGHEVHTAYDAAHALEMSERIHPEVVLLDVVMPQVTGYELARRLRAEPWGRDALLVAVTGWGRPDSEEDGAAVDLQLSKPVRAAALQEVFAAGARLAH
ncbi:MAG TPA: response regulator, partial [Candidatus Binatia bacterium]|nr:response regulator [Candidatus Binatia bacterium]